MCKCMGCILCLGVLAAAGVLAWWYGPWRDDSAGDASGGPILAAVGACEGCCNGLALNCGRAADEVTWAMVHNAHSSREDLFAGYNNERPLEDALVAGYRGLMLDSCICDGSLMETIQGWVKGEDRGDNYLGFCHGSCDAGVRHPAEVFGNIKKFLDTNKNEVVMLEFEINDDSLPRLFAAIDDSGLDDYVYRPAAVRNVQTVQSWPTLQSLIDADSRLLLFAHGDGMDSCSVIDCPEGISYTYDYFAQTDWNDDTCGVVRGRGEAAPFFLMNHWRNNDVDLPSRPNAEEFNRYESLSARFGRCEGRVPNVVAVDFWDVGDVLPFVREANQRGGRRLGQGSGQRGRSALGEV